MTAPGPTADSLTPAQTQAVAARGNVLVMAGAGTGKTKTLVARCLDCLERERVSLDELLIVTFTEAAAAEMRQRLRRALEAKADAAPADDHWPHQLALFDIAPIGTLHSFCLRLVREHFYELGLDPQLVILDAGEARQLAGETLDEQLQAHYAGEDEFSIAVKDLIQVHGGGRDENIRQLILRLHHYSQTRPDAAGWLARQLGSFSTAEPADWQRWLLTALADWRDEWRPGLENLKSENVKALELTGIFQGLGTDFTRESAAGVLAQIIAADDSWPAKRKTLLRPPLKNLFDEAAFLATLAPVTHGSDPLAEDWGWVRGHMATLLRLAREFAEKFSERKRADGVLDFHDLEQFALKLLWDFSAGQPTAVAAEWRAKLKFVFVDEYQDINAAQDKIIAALASDGIQANRFLVGDVKQSIYRFRLADPKIFRDYARAWRGENGRVIPLAENFRSREGLLNFVNSVFSLILREEIGGVGYDADAQLKFGAPEKRAELGVAKNPSPRVELLLRRKPRAGEVAEDGNNDLADLDETTKEARSLAQRLKQLAAGVHEIWDDEKKALRPARFSDMAVLLRSPRGKAEIYAQEFERAGVPLAVARGGFFETAEILDLLSLLQLLDNPLQDVPCIAVLRSPLVGLSLDELAEIRLAAPGRHFWTALVRWREVHGQTEKGNLFAKVDCFLTRFARWRKQAKQASLSDCLEAVLTETLYADWLRAQPRGAQRVANIEQFLNLAQSFDQFQRQGLFRFLKFIEAQQAAEVEPEISAGVVADAVRLMSIHQSKGQEFPVVALPDLAKRFNEQDLRGDIIFDEEFGLCPQVKPPGSGRRYPSLPHWLARKRQQRELRGEELRLLYVAMTRARDTLILSATLTDKKWETLWSQPVPVTAQTIAAASSFADWLGLWFSGQNFATPGALPHLRWRWVADAELADAGPADSEKPEAEGDLAGLDAVAVEKLRGVLNWEYPHLAATRRKAKASVTELRRAAEETDDEAEPVFSRPRFAAKNPTRKTESGKRKLSAADTGTAHHKFLQHVALETTGDLTTEADRLAHANFLSADERAALDLAALAAFWNSELGGKIRANAADVRRELPFTARFSPAEVAAITGGQPESGLENEFVVVQGVADLVVLRPAEIWLVDFKTDAAGADAEKIKIYTPQLKLYASALEKIFTRPVTRRALYFLADGQTREI
jgi:ATP-dependent helicase/nuclease subunit A